MQPVKARDVLADQIALEGCSLHADTWVHQNDRDGLERLANYGARDHAPLLSDQDFLVAPIFLTLRRGHGSVASSD